MAGRVRLLDALQRAHEDVKAAVGLEVARHIGDDRVARLQLHAAGRDEAGLPVGAQLARGDALVLHADFRLKELGVAAALPLRGRDGRVAVREVQRMQRVPGADARPVVELQRKFGVKTQVSAIGVVVPLAQVDELRVGVYVLGIQGFAPARMRQDHVGLEAALAQFEHEARAGLAMQGGSVHLAQVGVLLVERQARQAVTLPGLEARQAWRGIPRQGAHVPARALRPGAHQVAELARKVLMDDEHAHGAMLTQLTTKTISPALQPREICSQFVNGAAPGDQCPMEKALTHLSASQGLGPQATRECFAGCRRLRPSETALLRWNR